MLTTVDLALSYLHLLLAKLHQVGIKYCWWSSKVSSGDLQTATYCSHPAGTALREAGRTAQARSWSHTVAAFMGFLLSLAPIHPGLWPAFMASPCGGMAASENSFSSQKEQQSLSLLCWLWQMEPRIYQTKWFHILNTSTCMRAVNQLILSGNLPSLRQLLITKNQKGAERQMAGKPQRRLQKWTIMTH